MKKKPCAFIIMGVAGAGKSTVAAALASHFDAAFLEGDNFHPQTNVDKMARGEPLDDRDRAPWIDALAAAVSNAPQPLVFASCSALSESVRARFEAAAGRRISFLLLDAPEDAIRRRLEARQQHFMKADMLRSQFAAFERPREALVVDAAAAPDAVLAAAVAAVEMRLAAIG